MKLLSTLNTGESSTESNNSSGDAQNGVVPHCGKTESSSDLLLAALLEHLCSLYVSDYRRRNQLFTLLYGQLKKLKLICPVAGLDELGSIRSQYKVGFMKLVQTALASVDKESHMSLSAESQERVHVFLDPWKVSGCLPSVLDLGLLNSRCEDEFAEISMLGTGGFGEVHKVRNKLDNCDYAIKKIYFRNKNVYVWIKILREAKHLAALSHKHIVRYYASWLEYSNPFTTLASRSLAEPSQSTHLPALLCDVDATCTKEESDSSSHSITFETTSAPQHDSFDSCQDNQHSYSSCHGKSAAGWQKNSSGDSPWCSTTNCGIMKNAYVVLHIQMEPCSETLWHWLQERNTTVSSTPSSHGVYSLVHKEENANILRQILKAVDYIHGRNIIHRDLKPKNIFLVIDDNKKVQVKIGDFGLSRIGVTNSPMTPNPGHESAAGDTEHCYTSGVGTTSYAAPEQLNSCCYSTKSDIFSIGLIMYELYQPFFTEMEKYSCLRQLREKHQVASEFSEAWPQQAVCIEKLTGIAEDRPTAAQILQEEFLCSKDQIIASLHCTVKSQQEQIQSLQERISQLEQQLSKQENQ